MATETLHLTVRGMTCENCARTIQTKLSRTPGVVHASVNLDNAEATVEYDNQLVQPNKIADAVRQLGYQVPA
jgi:P-type Cu+ transporter